jgi:hypothetical protein
MSRQFIRAAGFALAIALILAVSPASATGGPSTDQRFVPDVVAQFDALALRPDGLAFDPGTSPTPTLCQHYQGSARGQGADGTPYLFVTRSGVDLPACIDDDTSGTLIVVRLGSREKTGERLRSNRLRRNWAIDDPDWESPPDSRDVVVTSIHLDGSGWPAYRHPGGMQLVDNVLAIGTENPFGDETARATILFVDVSNPEDPQLRSRFNPDLTGADAFGADPVGLTAIKAPGGECCLYLMVVAGGPANKEIRFYRSLPTDDPTTPQVETTTDLKSEELDWEEVGRYGVVPLIVEDFVFPLGTIAGCSVPDWPIAVGTFGGQQHQMLNFARQGGLDGPLFLVAGRNTFGPLGSDFIDLYQVNLTADGDAPASCPLTRMRATHVNSYPFGGGGDSANFAAAAGTYVSPSGELIVYATEHHNEGPFRMNLDGSKGNRRTVRFGEFRHRHVVRPDSPTLHPTATLNGPFAVDEGSSVVLTGAGAPPITQAWIQLYEDDGAGASLPGFGDSDEWLAVDYADRDADDYGDLDALDYDSALETDLDFEENAESWRWFAPVGCTISANDYPDHSDEFPGPDTVLLAGTGEVQVETDLDDIDYDDDVGGITFGVDCDGYYNAPIGLSWDLDGDNSFETNGTSATFSAASLDGPSTATVHARGTHPTDTSVLGTGAPVPVPIEVRNVPPSVGAITAPAGAVQMGVPTSLSAPFTDPGRADTHTAVWDWGDGTTSAGVVTESNGSGTVTGSHTYTTANFYTVTVTVTDDDLGWDQSESHTVIVYDPARTLSVNAKIVSPAGAYTSDATKTGDAFSTSTARYKNGVPNGSTSFQFNAATFSFRSGSYDWLVSAGGRAYLQGKGSVNGVSGYSFLLSVVDGSPDKYRLKVWNTTSNAVVYDSQPGAPINAPATTPLVAGSVVLG